MRRVSILGGADYANRGSLSCASILGRAHPSVHRFFHMGLAALHAAREPLSDCMTVVPFETAALADFRRPSTCGEDADSTGGRPAFFERDGVGDFFLAAIRASCLKTDESPSRVRRSVQLPYASARPSRSTLLTVPRSTRCYPRPHASVCQTISRGTAGHGDQRSVPATRSNRRATSPVARIRRAAAPCRGSPNFTQELPRKLLPTRAKEAQRRRRKRC